MQTGTLIGSDRTPANDPLRADCGRCRGLCCILLPFDADQGFAFAKDAGTPCTNLAADFSCTIHGELAERGFPGCARYECHGAGQYVSALLGLGARWFESEPLVREAYGLFATARTLHGSLKAKRIQGRHAG